MSLETSSTRPPEEFPRLPFCPTGFRKLDIKPVSDVSTSYYFRFLALDMPGVLSKISGILGKYQISIAAVIQKGRHTNSVPLVMITHDALESSVRKALDEIDNLDEVLAPTVLIRIENNAD